VSSDREKQMKSRGLKKYEWILAKPISQKDMFTHYPRPVQYNDRYYIFKLPEKEKKQN
jgi:hypothetical protein